MTESWLKRRMPRLVSPGTSGPTAPAAQPRRPLHGPPRRLIVCGDDPLAHRLIDELVTRYGVEVTAVLPNRRRNHGPQIAALLEQHQGRVIESDRLDVDAFTLAGVAGADALALVKQDDVGNIHAALQAQELNPRIRLVLRMFNMRLGHGVRRLFGDCRVLSDAQMAAPAFVSAALGEVAPVHIRLASRTLFVARRADVRAEDIVCGLATASPQGRSDLLPADLAAADLVLAVARGERIATVLPTRGDGLEPSQMVVVSGARQVRRKRLHLLRRWLRPSSGAPSAGCGA